MALQAQSRQAALIWPSPRPRSRSTITLLRSEPRKHADTTAHFVDKPHFAPQNKYRFVFFHLCPSGGTGRRASFRNRFSRTANKGPIRETRHLAHRTSSNSTG